MSCDALTGDTEEEFLCRSGACLELFCFHGGQGCVHLLYSSTRSSSEVGERRIWGELHT